MWADLQKQCLKGSTVKYEGRKVFVGNGELQVSRDEVFKENQRGVGVLMNQRKNPYLDTNIYFLIIPLKCIYYFSP